MWSYTMLASKKEEAFFALATFSYQFSSSSFGPPIRPFSSIMSFFLAPSASHATTDDVDDATSALSVRRDDNDGRRKEGKAQLCNANPEMKKEGPIREARAII